MSQLGLRGIRDAADASIQPTFHINVHLKYKDDGLC